MPFDPADFLGEVLGRPVAARGGGHGAARVREPGTRHQGLPGATDTGLPQEAGRGRAVAGFDPESLGFRCPFMGTRCVKRSTALGRDVPYPVCTVRKVIGGEPKLYCVCPKRFFSVDFLTDVVQHCWRGHPPANPQLAREVKLAGFGNVDLVIADVGQDGAVADFLSVELQAIDFSGSVRPAYQALREGKDLEERPTYNPSMANVYKRYVTQLIRKGYSHHHWGSRIVAVIQDVFYDYICNWAEFMRSDNVTDSSVNIIFMAYRYADDPTNPGAQTLVLDKVEGTSHANLQQAVLYKEAPSRDDFCRQIERALRRSGA